MAALKGQTTIEADVLTVLRQCTMTESAVVLPPGQLDRKLYEKVNKVLGMAGGKWTRKAQAHVFATDPRPYFASLFETGTASNPKKALGQFFTPPALAARMAELAAIQPGDRVLEPSAGTGNLAAAARLYTEDIVCVEITADAVQRLRNWGFRAQCQDFLTVTPADLPPVDVILMNPPFGQGQEVAHVLHALQFLTPGGRLVAVLSNAITFRQDNSYTELRTRLAAAGEGFVLPLPDDTFKEAGTSVRTVLLTITRPAA
jgi:predicted RNA methylase